VALGSTTGEGSKEEDDELERRRELVSRVMASSEGSQSHEDGFRNGDDESGDDLSDKK